MSGGEPDAHERLRRIERNVWMVLRLRMVGIFKTVIAQNR